MLIEVEFPNNDENGLLKGTKFNFVNQKTSKPYETIIFIGENGKGKTSFFDYFRNHVPYISGDTTTLTNPLKIKIPIKKIDVNVKKYCCYKSNNYPLASNAINENKFICVNLSNSHRKQEYLGLFILENDKANIELNEIFYCIDTKRSNRQPKELSYSSIYLPSRNSFSRTFDHEDISICRTRIVSFTLEKFEKLKNLCNEFWKKTKSNLLIERKYGETASNGLVWEIEFKKNGTSVKIYDLSSGEQEILIWASLLLEFDSLDYFTIFIDEPEISLHPIWQKNILSFYQNLIKGSKNVQLFIATHSPYIVESAMQNLEKNALINFNGIGNEKMFSPLNLNKNHVSFDELNYKIFGVLTNGYYLELFEYLKNIKNKDKSYDEFDEYLIKKYKLENLIIDFNKLKITKLSNLRHFIAHNGNDKNFNCYQSTFEKELNNINEQAKEFYSILSNSQSKKYEDLLSECTKKLIELIKKEEAK